MTAGGEINTRHRACAHINPFGTALTASQQIKTSAQSGGSARLLCERPDHSV
jgi:hypothetical protein